MRDEGYRDWSRHYREGLRLYEHGEDAAAERALRQAAALAARRCPDDEPLACCLVALGRLEEAHGRPRAAVRLYRRALRTEEAAVGGDDPRVALILRHLAHALRRAGEPIPAAGAELRAEEIWRRGYAAHHGPAAAQAA